MAKIYGLFGSMTGKLADVVMAVRNGEQVARKYQPIVANPNTQAQVESRAKLKLMSQLSAVMAPVIAMRREGSVSARNMFVKANYGQTTYSSNQADIRLENVKLTKSVVSFPSISAARFAEGIQVYIDLAESPATLNLDRVVYVMFVKDTDGTLRYNGSQIANGPGQDSYWTVVFPVNNKECIFYAYGVRDNTEAARVTFGNMQTVTAEAIAKLIVTRTLVEADITLTETRAITLPVATTAANAAPIGDGNRAIKKVK